MLFIHGLGGTGNVWEPQARALADRFTLVRFDLQGSGRSPVRGPLSIDAWVSDIDAIMGGLGVERACIVAHSLGTLIAQHYAVRNPDRISRLALVGVNRAPEDSRRQTVRDRAAKVRQEGMLSIADGVINVALSEQTRRNKPEVVACVREMLLRQDPEGYARSCEAVAESVGVDLRRIACPVLLLAGSDDSVSPPAVSQKMAEELPEAKAVVLENCGHWLTLERPFDVSRALAEFLPG